MKQIRFSNHYETLWGNTLYGLNIADDVTTETLCNYIKKGLYGQFSEEIIETMCNDIIAGEFTLIENLKVIWIY